MRFRQRDTILNAASQIFLSDSEYFKQGKVTFSLHVCNNFHCYLAHACTNMRFKSEMHLLPLPNPYLPLPTNIRYTVADGRVMVDV